MTRVLKTFLDVRKCRNPVVSGKNVTEELGKTRIKQVDVFLKSSSVRVLLRTEITGCREICGNDLTHLTVEKEKP